ncbi:hypothetical protein LINGRAHAP2_LOCUS9312 [Linum grandiflorum]
MRRVMRTRRTRDGWEVDQLYEDIPGGNTDPPPVEQPPTRDEPPPIQSSDDDGDSSQQNLEVSDGSGYRESSDSDHIGRNNSEEEVESVYERQPWYNPNCDHKTLVFKKGMRFTSNKQFQDAVVEFSIVNGAGVYWVRSSQRKKEVVCRVNCGWWVYTSWYARNRAFVVKLVGLDHSCFRAFEVLQLTAKWIAKKYLDNFRRSQNVDTVALAAEISHKYNLDVAPHTVYMAKLIAKRMLEGSLSESYGRLRSYILEFKRADPGGGF